MLTLSEKLVLLALVDHEGEVGRTGHSRDFISYGLACSIIMELMLSARVTVELPRELFLKITMNNGKVKLLDASPTGDDVLDEALSKLRQSGKGKSPFHWIKKLRGLTTGKNLPTFGTAFRGSCFLDRMVDKGILYRKKHSTLGYKTPRYPLLDEQAKRSLIESVHDAILRESNDPEMTMLISLASTCGLIGEIPFSSAEAPEVEGRVKAIVDSDPVVRFLTRQVVAAKTSDEVPYTGS